LGSEFFYNFFCYFSRSINFIKIPQFKGIKVLMEEGAVVHDRFAGEGDADSTQNDEITTLFVSGFPPDLMSREVHNLFRWFPGYEGSIIKQPKGKVIIFSSFLFSLSLIFFIS
jgi:hypothetical protein